MPTIFARLEDRVSRACDRIYGDVWDLQAMMDSAGGGRRVVDAARGAVLGFTAIFSSPVKESTEFGSEARGTLARFVNETTLSIDLKQVDAAGQPLFTSQPRRFDRVTRRETGQTYELGHGQIDGEGRHKFWLKEISA